MKKELYAGLSVLALGAVMVMPAHAAETSITVGVTDTKPEVLSVNVPATVPMAIIADSKGAPTDAPKVLIGTTTTAGTENAQLKFQNTGTTDLSITRATVSNLAGSPWTLSSTAISSIATAAEAHKMTLGFGTLSTLAADVLPGAAQDMTGAAIDITAGGEEYVTMTAAVGGTNADYTKTNDAQVFHVTWTIAKK